MRNRYIGIRDPAAAMLEFAPYQKRLAELRGSFSPATPQYRALLDAEMRLREAADLITCTPNFLVKPSTDFASIGDKAKADHPGRA